MGTGHALGGKYTDTDFDVPKDGSNETIAFQSEAKLSWLGFNPFIRVGRWVEFEEASYRPYFILGAGLYQVWYKEGFTSLEGKTTRNISITNRKILQAGNSDTNFGINLGVGVDQRLHDNFSIGVDLRYHHVYGAIDQDLDGGDDDSLTLFAPSLKFTYHF